jgi:hypothetical protein
MPDLREVYYFLFSKGDKMNTYELPNVQSDVIEAHYIRRIDPTKWDVVAAKSLENDGVEVTYSYNGGDPLLPTTIRLGVYHKPNALDKFGGRTNISAKFTTQMLVMDEDDELVGAADHVTTVAWSGPYRATLQADAVASVENIMSLIVATHTTPALETISSSPSALLEKLLYGNAEIDPGTLPELATA